jgi:cytochrome c peroxidase
MRETTWTTLATFEQTLLTPDSRFDRWLRGDATALSPIEMSGYMAVQVPGLRFLSSGVNVGGNLFQRHGIFHPLASPRPEILRVPSLRNVATTAPYFHDGSAPNLDDAVRKMGLAQLQCQADGPTDQGARRLPGTLTGKFSRQALWEARHEICHGRRSLVVAAVTARLAEQPESGYHTALTASSRLSTISRDTSAE